MPLGVLFSISAAVSSGTLTFNYYKRFFLYYLYNGDWRFSMISSTFPKLLQGIQMFLLELLPILFLGMLQEFLLGVLHEIFLQILQLFFQSSKSFQKWLGIF